jgi:hypothetical protein
MSAKKPNLIDEKIQDLYNDGVDRRGFLKCMAWAGTGLVWTLSGGVPVSRAFAKDSGRDASKGAGFSFVQISDSHIGFNKPANPDVTATLQTAINKINAMPNKPDFIIHTGDLSQLSKPGEFDTLDQVLKGASAKPPILRRRVVRANLPRRGRRGEVISSAMGKVQRALAGPVSITRVCISLVW